MKIKELIDKLQKFEQQYGNLECVTPGFDEYGFEKIKTIEILELKEQSFSGKDLEARKKGFIEGKPLYLQDQNTERSEYSSYLNIDF